MLPARLRTLVVAALLALACSPKGGGSGKFGTGPLVTAPSTPEVSTLERQMHDRLNRDRAKKGLPPLELDAELADVARAHSKDMHERDFFAHDSPRTGSLEDRLDRAGRLVQAARENIGEGPTVDATQDALLESPGHYANIMAKDVSHVGIGIVRIGKGPSQRLLVTQVFARPIRDREQDPDAARRAVAQKLASARRAAGLGALPAHPLLDRLAQKHVSEVPDDLDKSASERIGEAVTKELRGSDLSGVAVGTTVFLTPELYEASGAAAGPKARAIGIATAPARDARGRPAIKALLLIGF